MDQQFDALLAGLGAMDRDERREALVEYRQVVFSEPFINLVESRAASATAAEPVSDPRWHELPAFLTTVFGDGERLWNERVRQVWLDMAEVSQTLVEEELAKTPATPEPAPVAPSTPAATPPGRRPTPVSTGTGSSSDGSYSGPTHEEITEDFVRWDRQQWEHRQDEIDYNRVQDDYQDWSTPSYDNHYDQHYDNW